MNFIRRPIYSTMPIIGCYHSSIKKIPRNIISTATIKFLLRPTIKAPFKRNRRCFHSTPVFCPQKNYIEEKYEHNHDSTNNFVQPSKFYYDESVQHYVICDDDFYEEEYWSTRKPAY